VITPLFFEISNHFRTRYYRNASHIFATKRTTKFELPTDSEYLLRLRTAGISKQCFLQICMAERALHLNTVTELFIQRQFKGEQNKHEDNIPCRFFVAVVGV
jgi:hypothetical protein